MVVILAGVVLAIVSVLLLLRLARATAVKSGRFGRGTAVATLGLIMVAALLFSTGLVLIGVSALLSFGAAG